MSAFVLRAQCRIVWKVHWICRRVLTRNVAYQCSPEVLPAELLQSFKSIKLIREEKNIYIFVIIVNFMGLKGNSIFVLVQYRSFGPLRVKSMESHICCTSGAEKLNLGNKFSLTNHVAVMAKKAHQHLNFLSRLRKFGMSSLTLNQFYRCTTEASFWDASQLGLTTALPETTRHCRELWK